MTAYTAKSGKYTLTLTVTQGTQDIANNTSPVNWSLTLVSNGGTLYHWNDTCPWNVKLNGTQVGSGTYSYDLRSGGTQTIISKSGSTTITHNGDGTKSISVYAYTDMDNSTYVSPMSISDTFTLTTIPRASDVSVGNYTVANTGGHITATITSKANFYHKWRWRMNSGTWSDWATKGQINTTSSTVTVANTTLLAQLPTATSGSFNIEVATYSDSGYSNHVGTKSATCTVSVNTTNIKPSVSLGNIGLNSTPISGYAVAGYSKVQSAWSTSNSYGASSVTTYFTVSTGSLATTSSSSTSGTVVSNTIPSNSSNYTLTIYAYAKDSRGAVGATVSKAITVYGYQPPTANLTAYRTSSSSSTSEDGAGTYAYVTFSGAVRSSVNSQNSIQSTSCKYSGSISGTATNGGHYALADTQTVTFKLTVTDKVTSSTASVTISPASYPLDLVDDGNGNVGVGMGTIAQAGYVVTPLTLRVSNDKSSGGVDIREDGEGGTIDIYSKSGKTFEIDAYSDDVLRVFAYNDSNAYREAVFNRVTGTLSATGGFNGKATSAGTADNATNAKNATYAQYPVIMDMNNKNLNDVKMQGVYYGNTGMTNAPVQTIATMEVIRYSGDWLVQRFMPMYSDGTHRVWQRTYYGGSTWSGWYRISTWQTIWTGTLKGQNGISVALKPYTKIRVWVCLYGVTGHYDIDLTKTNAVMQVDGHPYSSGVVIAEYNASGVLELLTSQAVVNTNKNWFYHWHCGYQAGATATNKDNDNNYYIYRIDGII